MSCNQGQSSNNSCQSSGRGYVIVIVLYILLAIMLGSWLAC